MRKVYVEVITRLIINMDDDLSVSEVVDEMDYNFTSTTDKADIQDTEIIDFTIMDSK